MQVLVPLRRAAADRALAISWAETALLVLIVTALIIAVFRVGHPPIEYLFPATNLFDFP
jgi:hypothetical protein